MEGEEGGGRGPRGGVVWFLVSGAPSTQWRKGPEASTEAPLDPTAQPSRPHGMDSPLGGGTTWALRFGNPDPQRGHMAPRTNPGVELYSLAIASSQPKTPWRQVGLVGPQTWRPHPWQASQKIDNVINDMIHNIRETLTCGYDTPASGMDTVSPRVKITTCLPLKPHHPPTATATGK